MKSHFTSSYTLRPNCTYTVNGTTYGTNANGQIEYFSGPLSRQAAPRSPSAQRNLPGKLPSEDAGHLIAASAGGSGKVDNLTRMDRQANERDYAAFERDNRTLLAEGKEVTLTGSLAYAEGSDRPTAFMVERTVTDPVTGEVSSEHLSWTNEDMAFFDDVGEEAYALADEFPNPGREPDYDMLTDCMSTANSHSTASLAQTNVAAETNVAGTSGADTAAAGAASAAASSSNASTPAASASAASHGGSSRGGPGL